MKTFILFLILVAASTAQAAQTFNLTSASQDAFEDCLYRGKVGGVFVKYVEAGDTIALPAGSATWGAINRGNQGIIYITLPITIKGQGDSTVITLDESGMTYATSVIALWSDGIAWKDMKIKGAQNRPVTAIGIGGSGIRITNITYEGQAPTVSGGSPDGYFVFSQGGTGTLIDHCRISAAVGNQEWIFTRGPSDAWQKSSTLGTSQADVFVEDCIFSNTGYSDANSNARHVFRFNTITGNIKFDAHGAASNSPARSFRNVEYYNNTWTSPAMNTSAAIEVRGGTAMVFNNASTTGLIYLRDYLYDNTWPNFGRSNVQITAGNPTIISTNEPHGYQTGWPIFVDCGAQNIYGFFPVTKISDTAFSIAKPDATSGIGWNVRRLFTAFDYPLPDQVGNGKDGGPREPAYLWGNTQNGSNWARTVATPNSSAQTLYAAQTGRPGATFTERDVIQANRDFYASAGFDLATGVSVGTRAQMNAYTPSVAGYGWWVTDEGSWNTKLPANTSGRLYKWTGSAWTLFYTPYTYPHPLQTSTEVAQPEPSVKSGTYEYPQSITLAVNPTDAVVRYTTDGSIPSMTSGSVYNGTPIVVSSTTTLKAIAYKTGLRDSPVLDATYTVTGQVFQPTASKGTNSYHGSQTLTLSCATAGASIFYTLDGSNPTSSSTPFTSALTIDRTTTVRAIGVKGGLATSTALGVTITILNEIGNWEVGTTSQLAYNAGERSGLAYFTASVTGNLTQISVYGTNTSPTQSIEFGLYRDTSGSNTGALTKVSNASAQFTNIGAWTASWRDFQVFFPVTAGEKYWIFLGVAEASSLGITATYAGGTNDRWNNYATYGSAWNDFGPTTNRDGWRFNIKGTLTEAGTPASPLPNKVPAVQINIVVEPPK